MIYKTKEEENMQYTDKFPNDAKSNNSGSSVWTFFIYSFLTLLLILIFGAAYYIVFKPDLSFLGFGSTVDRAKHIISRNPDRFKSTQEDSFYGNLSINKNNNDFSHGKDRQVSQNNPAPTTDNNSYIADKNDNELVTQNDGLEQTSQNMISENKEVNNGFDKSEINNNSDELSAKMDSSGELSSENNNSDQLSMVFEETEANNASQKPDLLSALTNPKNDINQDIDVQRNSKPEQNDKNISDNKNSLSETEKSIQKQIADNDAVTFDQPVNNTPKTEELAGISTGSPPKELSLISKNSNSENNGNLKSEELNVIIEGDDFKIDAPDNVASFILPTEQEFNNKKTLLEQLQEAKRQNIETSGLDLPSASYSLTNQASTESQDLHISNNFLNELAKLAVNKFTPTDNVQKNALTVTEASRYFGLTMKGLEHPNGRIGIFEYAYNPQLIKVLTRSLAPVLIDNMENAAKARLMSNEQISSMFKFYAGQASVTANQLQSIVGDANIDINLNEYLEVEKSLNMYREEFAKAQLEFSELSRNNKRTSDIEAMMKELAKKASASQQELVSIRNIIIANIAKNSGGSPQNSLLNLALWVKRRDNDEATKSAIEALYYISDLLEKR